MAQVVFLLAFLPAAGATAACQNGACQVEDEVSLLQTKLEVPDPMHKVREEWQDFKADMDDAMLSAEEEERGCPHGKSCLPRARSVKDCNDVLADRSKAICFVSGGANPNKASCDKKDKKTYNKDDCEKEYFDSAAWNSITGENKQWQNLNTAGKYIDTTRKNTEYTGSSGGVGFDKKMFHQYATLDASTYHWCGVSGVYEGQPEGTVMITSGASEDQTLVDYCISKGKAMDQDTVFIRNKEMAFLYGTHAKSDDKITLRFASPVPHLADVIKDIAHSSVAKGKSVTFTVA